VVLRDGRVLTVSYAVGGKERADWGVQLWGGHVPAAKELI
jgi:hypothetical protein